MSNTAKRVSSEEQLLRQVTIENQHCNRPIPNTIPSQSGIWIFGYGSLIWKVDFPYLHRRCGYILGYLRRFYQHSIDHRGTPLNPGRVCTLIPSTNPAERVWGVAYEIEEEFLEQLDYREKNGYTKLTLPFTPQTEYDNDPNPVENVIVYVATEENESFAGHKETCEIARQIFNSNGPSGTNREYVHQLANAMRVLFPDYPDEHLYELDSMLKMMGVVGSTSMLQCGLVKNGQCGCVSKSGD